jgi:threonine dehydrogenase-like Zn-dependent dehydrogenase
LPSNQSPLGALPSRFKRERLLIIGCGDVGQRVVRVQRHVRVVALTSSPERVAALRAQGVTPVVGIWMQLLRFSDWQVGLRGCCT